MADDAQPYTDAEVAALLDVDALFIANVSLARLKATLAARDRRISELKATIRSLKRHGGVVHDPSCPRLQYWDAGDFDAPCTCDNDD